MGGAKMVPEWVAELQKLPYAWGTDYLPHDAENTARQTGVDDVTVLKRLNRKVKVVPRGDVEAGIRTTRLLFPRAYIDAENGAELVECLKKYRRAIPVATGEPGDPVHDEFSHGADAWRALGQVIEKVKNELTPPKIVIPARPMTNRRIGY
jgi:phage terminase large subunit